MPVKALVERLAREAYLTSQDSATLSSDIKNGVLRAIALGLRNKSDHIQQANAKDLSAGKGTGLTVAMLDRLKLDDHRIQALAGAVEEIIALPDPVGQVSRMSRRPNGLLVGKSRIPLGVIAFIYESRPNVTIEAAALCLKSGNAVILRGGKEALHTNIALGEIIGTALEGAGIARAAVTVIDKTDRAIVGELLKQEATINLVIPRGGEGLIRRVAEESRIPVIKHYKGVCHVYVDKDADLEKAQAISMNSKLHRTGVCNAMETLLIHQDVAQAFLPGFLQSGMAQGLEVRGCERTVELGGESVKEAGEDDWHAEYLDAILAVRVVDSYEDAVQHIRTYGSDHTEAIVTENYTTAQAFIRDIQSSLVLVNASTRFNDGGQLGLGAEIGISTTRLHAYGPMGLEHLTIEKYIAYGDGQIRE